MFLLFMNTLLYSPNQIHGDNFYTIYVDLKFALQINLFCQFSNPFLRSGSRDNFISLVSSTHSRIVAKTKNDIQHWLFFFMFWFRNLNEDYFHFFLMTGVWENLEVNFRIDLHDAFSSSFKTWSLAEKSIMVLGDLKKKKENSNVIF